jgi:hypothetical protein
MKEVGEERLGRTYGSSAKQLCSLISNNYWFEKYLYILPNISVWQQKWVL